VRFCARTTINRGARRPATTTGGRRQSAGVIVMAAQSSNIIPLHPPGSAARHWANLRALAGRVRGMSVEPMPDCGATLAEIRTDCAPMGLPGYCALCERNPANRTG
jgi:hypothetical protein